MKITKVEPLFIAVPYEHGGPKQMRPLGPWTLMEVLFVRVEKAWTEDRERYEAIGLDFEG